jgi:drug/metabolite transporter (DMT)-like permease
MKQETLGKLACAFAGALWGLFWIPLRALERNGVDGLWTVFLFFFIPFLLSLPLLAWERANLREFGLKAQIPAMFVAVSSVLYSFAAIETTVYRALIFFYLTPLWSTLLGVAFLGESLTRARFTALGLGAIGIAVMTSGGLTGGLELNPGDWAALAGGVLWSIGTTMLRMKPDLRASVQTIGAFFWASLAAGAIALSNAAPAPSPAQVAGELWWLIPALALMVAPVVYLAIWGSRFVSPGTAGLLFMTEIGISAMSAALLSGDPLGWREIAGIVLITIAGLAEAVAEWRQRRPVSQT